MMQYSIQDPFLRVEIALRGAELRSILGADGTQYLWQGGACWPDRAPNLFPYVARLTDGAYYVDGRRYHMDIHGFAMRSKFSLVEQTDTRLTMELTSTDETMLIYPRAFAFRVSYEL